VIGTSKDVLLHPSPRLARVVLPQGIEQQRVLVASLGGTTLDGRVEPVRELPGDGAEQQRKTVRVCGQVNLAVESVAELGDAVLVTFCECLLVRREICFQLGD